MIYLIVRGICCLRPERKNLSENIKVISIIGEYLEHSRLYYFHNSGDPVIYSGSADVMIRSFKRRVESLFKINDEFIKKQAITILNYNLRDNKSICVVESPSDVLAIESTGGYRGRYFVLLGRLSPIDGVGPDELGINDLIKIIDQDNVKEIILATSSTVEGDATAIYIKDHVKKAKVSRISYGIPIGGELEYVDGTTIARAIEGRVEINVD